MRDVSDDFVQIAATTHAQRLIVDSFYDDELTFPNLPVTDWDLSWDLQSEIKSTGSLTVAYTSEAGESFTPKQFTDVLAPYGQQVNALIEVSAGGYSDTVQLGRFRINQSPEASDSYFKFRDITLTSGSLVKVTIDDLLTGVKRDGFHWPEPPILTSSTWNEIQRITGLPIDPNLPDLPTPAGLIYQPKEGGRLEAFQMLTSYLGGVGVTNSFGEITTIPFDFTDPIATLAMGQTGRVVSGATSIESDGLYNVVVGSYQEDDGTPIYSTATTTGITGPDSPFGEYTYYDQSDTVKTQAQADARTRSVLAQLRNGQTYQVGINCVADYRLEQGDVVEFRSLTGSIIGRMLTCHFTADGMMDTTIDVRRNVT